MNLKPHDDSSLQFEFDHVKKQCLAMLQLAGAKFTVSQSASSVKVSLSSSSKNPRVAAHLSRLFSSVFRHFVKRMFKYTFIATEELNYRGKAAKKEILNKEGVAPITLLSIAEKDAALLGY